MNFLRLAVWSANLIFGRAFKSILDRLELTQAGRRLLEKSLGASLVEAVGQGKDLASVQKNVSRLRDELLRAVQSHEAAKE